MTKQKQRQRTKFAAELMANPDSRTALDVLEFVFYEIATSDGLTEVEMDAVEKYLAVTRKREKAAK